MKNFLTITKVQFDSTNRVKKLSMNKKEEVLFITEVFSPKYVKRDFDRFLKMKNEDPFIFWGLVIYATINFVIMLGISIWYIIIAIIHVIKL